MVSLTQNVGPYTCIERRAVLTLPLELVTTSSQSNLTRSRITAAHQSFNHIHHVALMCTPI